jgi:predicted AAA+ superfamily ATPase
LFENLVFSELQKINSDQIYFFNEQQECDFIIHDLKNFTAIQACYQLTDENQAREIAGLQSAMTKLSIHKGVVITYDVEKKLTDNIHAIPFWKYFASNMV